MSAILGVYHRDGAPIEPQSVQGMLAASPYRAIDGQTIWMDSSVALAHQHFWITPEERDEIQPREDKSCGCTITSYARLDNRPVLVQTLGIGKDMQLPITDSEVILRAYLEWGVDCVKKFEGDFAFIIWDGQQQRLFAARDPLGAADVCFYLDQKLCLVTSEPGQILAYPGIPCELNEQKICDYLEGYYADQESTFYRNINYLLPAHCLLITRNEFSLWRYWDIDPGLRIRYRKDAEYAEHLEELLQSAVRTRLRTPGPVSISLSGGLDSTTIAAVIAKLITTEPVKGGPLLSFSYVFNDFPTADERQFIQPLVDKLGIQAFYLPGDERWTLRYLDDWPIYRDSPAQDPFVWLVIANQQAAQAAGSRVMFTGIFGDAFYLGGRYWAAAMLQDWRLGDLGRSMARPGGKVSLKTDILDYGIRANVPGRLKKAYRKVKTPVFPLDNPGIQEGFASRSLIQERKIENHQSSKMEGPGQWERYQALLMYGDAENIALQKQLANRDGVEFISPYFDRRLVEFFMAIPADQLYRPGMNKYILRNATRGWLPEVVRQRTKVSSLFPLFERGIREKALPDVQKILKNPQIVARGFVKRAWLETEASPEKNLTDEGYWLWLALSLELWLGKFW